MYPHSLNSAFMIRLLESIISKHPTGEILNFYLVSANKQACLSMTLTVRFCDVKPI